MKKITFLQLTAAVTMLAFGLMLAGPFVQSVDADGNEELCVLANISVDIAWDEVDEHCYQNPDFDKCNKAWETYGIVVAYRDQVCNGDDDEESSS